MYPRMYFLLMLTALTALPSAPSALAADQEPSQRAPSASPIHIEVNRVNVGVVVTDAHGQFVSGLQRENFHVFDNGIEQPITDFLSVDEPAQVLLLVEAGPAVYLLQSGHLQAVKTLLDGLAPGDRVAIARYNERAEPILNFVGDKHVAAGALDELHFNLGFGQLNLAASLLTTLDWLSHIPGKKSIVLLSTGFDTSQPSAVQDLLSRLKTTDVRVLTVSLTGATASLGPPTQKTRTKLQAADQKAQVTEEGMARASQELSAVAAANGSRVFFPETKSDFALACAQISQLIRHEYSLGFDPPARDAQVHAIEVQVVHGSESGAGANPGSGYRVDHRRAYLAPAPGS